MITCSICKTQNHHLSIVCSSCGGFLQTRIDNLDLFAVIWKIIESPFAAFRTIAIANHKNYSILLSSVAGMAFTFFAFWLFKLGDHAETLINILAAGLAIGPFLGIGIIMLFSTIVFAVVKFSGIVTTLRNVFAVSAYICVPIALSFLFIFPIEIMSFGTFLFTTNPSPYSLKPASYILFMILDGGSILWSLILMFIAMRSLLDIGWTKASQIVLISLLLFGGILALIERVLPIV